METKIHPKVKFAEEFFETNRIDDGRNFVIKLTKVQFYDFLRHYEDQKDQK